MVNETLDHSLFQHQTRPLARWSRTEDCDAVLWNRNFTSKKIKIFIFITV